MSLTEILQARIAAQGPLTMADFMTEALLHPTYGYYTMRDPFGTKGDFTTAPEISQMFGEVLGLCLAQSWIDQGAPTGFVLAELGPGRGTLMADILRATRAVPRFLACAKLILVEASPKMAARQAETLAGYDVTWCDTLDDIPEDPLWCVANEFFDALPIRQFQRGHADTWQERCVGLTDDRLTIGLAPPAPYPPLDHRLTDTQSGDVVEVSQASQSCASSLGTRIKAHGGAALIIDYGDWRSLGDTVQALKDHRPVDLLEAPGQADLTAHVDFEALANAASPAAHTRLTPQGVFLERLGITERAQALANRLTGAALDAHIAAHRRLTHPEEMGNLFKVLGLFPPGAPPPPGLNP